MNQLSNRIAAQLAPAKHRDHQRQDDAADRVAKIIDGWYLAVVKASGARVGLNVLIHEINAKYHRDLLHTYFAELEGLADGGYEDAVYAILGAMDKEDLLALNRSYKSPRLTESAKRPDFPERPFRMPRWGLPALDTAIIATLAKEEIKKLLKQIIFPPMPRKTIQQLLFQQQAMNRIAPITRLVTPQKLISIITQAQSKGLTRAEIARKELLPVFHTTKVDAMRVARTAGSLVANSSNMLAFQGLGELLVGYQCHCVTDKASRPWHQDRKGVVFYINPQEGQKGIPQCPQPPYEPPDPAERPADAPAIAWNCRCFLSPACKT